MYAFMDGDVPYHKRFHLCSYGIGNVYNKREIAEVVHPHDMDVHLAYVRRALVYLELVYAAVKCRDAF